MTTLQSILESFEPITLKEMDQVKLMDRIDTKFVFNISHLPEILMALAPHYRLLQVQDVQANHYRNLYFDTSDLLFYQHHHNRRSNRYKVRFRSYLDSGLSYFEIKFRSNHDRTVKERIRQAGEEEKIRGEAADFMRQRPALANIQLEPKLWINYTRLTLVNTTTRERLTIDTQLTFSNGQATAAYPKLTIAELKRDKCAPSPFLSLMREMHIRRCSISKYVLGIISLYNQVKMNNFRKKIRMVKKITDEAI